MQRLAAWVSDRAVQDCVTPQSLAARRLWRRHPATHANPAMQVLDQVSAVFAAYGHAGSWGPGGSVGFELASAVPCTTPASDLDLVLRLDQRIARSEARRLHAELSTLPVRMDVLLETPHGAVALSEFILAGSLTLLRAADGPRLVRNPWAADRAAASIP
jgi:phosphoribosyl-dephospho-CoA transferase